MSVYTTQFQLTINFDDIDTTEKLNQAKNLYNLDNDADWLVELHGNAYTKWSGESGYQRDHASEAKLSSRRIHEIERESDKRAYYRKAYTARLYATFGQRLIYITKHLLIRLNFLIDSTTIAVAKSTRDSGFVELRASVHSTSINDIDHG